MCFLALLFDADRFDADLFDADRFERDVFSTPAAADFFGTDSVPAAFGWIRFSAMLLLLVLGPSWALTMPESSC